MKNISKNISTHQFNSVLSRIQANNYLAQNQPRNNNKYHTQIENDILLLNKRLSNLFDYIQLTNYQHKKTSDIKTLNINKIIKNASTKYKLQISNAIEGNYKNNFILIEELIDEIIQFIFTKNKTIKLIKQNEDGSIRFVIEESSNNGFTIEKDSEEELLIRSAKLKALKKYTKCKIKFTQKNIDLYVSDII